MEDDFVSNDFINFSIEWSLFLAALRSYKSEVYLSEEINDFASKEILDKLWIEIGDYKRKGLLATEEDEQLHSIVQSKQRFNLSLLSSQEMDTLLQNFHYNNKLSEKVEKSKLMLFEVNYSDSGCRDNINRFSDQYGSFLALHGSPVNRFYSILQNGLHLPKSDDNPGLYGFGIYLTNKLDVALQFAQAHFFNCGWLQDESIKIVALCNVAKHPNAVVLKDHKHKDGFTFESGIPPEYYLVKDESMVHVTHILVETSCQVSSLQKKTKMIPGYELIHSNFIENLFAIFRRNWLLYIIIIYVGVLLVVACCKGRCVIFYDWDNSDLLNIDD